MASKPMVGRKGEGGRGQNVLLGFCFGKAITNFVEEIKSY